MNTEKCLTTGQLIEALAKYPSDTPIVSDGADSGRYDITYTIGINVEFPLSEKIDEGNDVMYYYKTTEKFPKPVVFLSGTDEDLWDLLRKGR